MLQIKKILLTSLCIGFAQSVLFSFAQVQEPVLTNASETLEFTITPSNFSSFTNNGVENIGSIIVSGVEVKLGVKSVSSSGTNLILTKDQGIIYNTTPLPGSVSKVNITQTTGQGTILNLGTESRLVNSVTNDFTLSGTQIGSTNSTTQEYIIANASTINYSYFALKANGGSNNTITQLKFTTTVAAVVLTNAATFNFSVEFVLGTNNKQGLCTAKDLTWSYWETEFNKLSDANQTAFRTDTSDSDIVAARQRYQYLRAFNPLLVNFASL
jgi:hypothetical protein